jgi:hypothetical protein
MFCGAAFKLYLCYSSVIPVLGKRFQHAGMDDILMESGIVAAGSLNGVISGHHYNRAIHAHKLLAEAMSRLRWEAFEDDQTIDDQAVTRYYIIYVQ